VRPGLKARQQSKAQFGYPRRDSGQHRRGFLIDLGKSIHEAGEYHLPSPGAIVPEMEKEPRVQLGVGLNRTKKTPTSMPTQHQGSRAPVSIARKFHALQVAVRPGVKLGGSARRGAPE
jgi:hypothetical protein